MATSPAMMNSTVGTKLENGAGNSGCHPPKNNKVATQQTVTMLAYSAMKNEANFMLLYSVWKPATSSFSASGRSKGTRLVSANPAIRNTRNAIICGNGLWKMLQLGTNPK